MTRPIQGVTLIAKQRDPYVSFFGLLGKC